VWHSKPCSKGGEVIAVRNVQEDQSPLTGWQPTMRFEEPCSERRRQRFCLSGQYRAGQNVSYPRQCIRARRVLIELAQVCEYVFEIGELSASEAPALPFELKARPLVVNAADYGKHAFFRKF
jgi:hypothetical protein